MNSVPPIDGPVLETERLVLRPPTGEDYPGFRDLIMSDRGRYIGGPLEDEGRAWRAFASIIGHWHMRGYGTFAVTDTDSGATLGVCGHWNPGGWPALELGWSLFEGQEGKGIATEAALAVRDFSFLEMNVDHLYSYIDPHNHRSIAVVKRLGAVLDSTATTPGEDTQAWRHDRPAGLTQ